ncbi:Hint domain-containing protein [Paracoccus sulfuroxidans]|uniref:Hint domain-containing protein n=1 Tax=Paracoccus sulfuroxidans TaxID=384678 RepID=A0A562NGL7_9RHOB|nr:Hint domain-containing protein [Paracoccus sulfuroxidans]TWI31228.1 Hint domain-containing protein [Paracoccus sulfuroxidans]
MSLTLDYDATNKVAHFSQTISPNPGVANSGLTVGSGQFSIIGLADPITYTITFDPQNPGLVIDNPLLSLTRNADGSYTISGSTPLSVTENGHNVSVGAVAPTGLYPELRNLVGVARDGSPHSVESWLMPGNSVSTISGFRPGSTVTEYDSAGNQITAYVVRANGALVISRSNPASTFSEGADFIVDGIPCFTRGTMMETAHGPLAIELLKAGDLVYTRDNGLQPIRWIGRRLLDHRDLSHNAHLRPIRIKTDALGQGLPSQDLLVSPQHRILLRSEIARQMFGADEVLIAAKQLLALDGFEWAADLVEVEYVHLLFDRHEIVIANGAETESLYTGPQALKSLGTAARDEIFAIFPELAAETQLPASARTILTGRQSKELAEVLCRS